MCESHWLRLVEEELDDVVSAFRMVEEDKEGPVNEPGPLLQGLERRAHGLKTENTAADAQHRPATHTHSGTSRWEIKHPGLVQGWQLHLINKLVMSREETMAATSGAVWLLLSIRTSLIINVVHVLLQRSPNDQTAVFTYSILLEHRH